MLPLSCLTYYHVQRVRCGAVLNVCGIGGEPFPRSVFGSRPGFMRGLLFTITITPESSNSLIILNCLQDESYCLGYVGGGKPADSSAGSSDLPPFSGHEGRQKNDIRLEGAMMTMWSYKNTRDHSWAFLIDMPFDVPPGTIYWVRHTRT